MTMSSSRTRVQDAYMSGELRVIVWNAGAEPVPVPRGMRIAQLVFARFVAPDVAEVTELSASERGTRGFGSTGR